MIIGGGYDCIGTILQTQALIGSLWRNCAAGSCDYRVPQLCLEPRKVPVRPMMAATMPPMSIQTALSVGDPVKNREMSELKECIALTPKTMSTIPPTRKTKAMSLFIKGYWIKVSVFGLLLFGSRFNFLAQPLSGLLKPFP